jgi:outer membrane receptor protein involved in Fe transport
MISLRKFLLGGTTVAGLAALVAAPAFAQAPTPVTPDTPARAADATEEVVQDTGTEEVVVVGSRIRRDVYNSPSPIQVVTREDATLSGFNATTEVLQSTAVTGGSGQINNAYGGFVTDGGPGANTIGLRGLGAGRTLVLINGRRVQPAGSRGAVGSADLNVLPSAMIQRVDVLRDGASSIYGSDAIAGVVNVITRPRVEGVTVEGQFNVPTNGGGEQGRISIVGGASGDRWSLSGSAEHLKREELTLEDRDWTRCNTDYRLNRIGGFRTDYVDPFTGAVKCYPITATGSNGVTINTVGVPTQAGTPGPGTTGTTFNRFRPSATSLLGEGVSLSSRDTFEPRMLNESLISPVEIATVFLQGTYDLQRFGDAQAYGEFLANRRRSEQTGYRQLTLDYNQGSPLLPEALRGGRFLRSSDTSGGLPVAARAFIGFGNDQSTQQVDFWKATAGIRGDFVLPDWRYDLTATTSKSSSEYVFQGFLIDRMTQSLDVVQNTDGSFACRITAGGCVAAPALTPSVVGGRLPADWVDYVFRPIVGTTDYTETALAAYVDGPLFTLPAGEVQGAFGVEYRKAEIDDTPGADSRNGNILNFTSSAPTRGTDSVWEAYAEVEVPLLRDAPFAETLTLNLSGRHTDYDSYGAGSTYKAGLVWEPTGWVSLRGSYGTSFRAPALFEQFQGGSTGFLSQSADPCYFESQTTATRIANCGAEGLPIDFNPTQGITVVTAGGAEQGLEAETSENYGFGVVLQPDLPQTFGDLAFAVDYYNIKIDNGVSQVGASAILDRCYDAVGFRSAGGLCRLISARDPSDDTLTVFDSYTNVATQRVSGIDYNLRWTRDVGPGALRLNASVTQFLDQSNRLFADDPFERLNGTIGAPAYTGTADATYAAGSWTARYGVEWIDQMDSDGYLGVDANDPANDYVFATDHYYTHNASVRYEADSWTATFGVRNLFDETPPSISSGFYNRVGDAPLYSGYDYVGRTVFLNVSKTF